MTKKPRIAQIEPPASTSDSHLTEQPASIKEQYKRFLNDCPVLKEENEIFANNYSDVLLNIYIKNTKTAIANFYGNKQRIDSLFIYESPTITDFDEKLKNLDSYYQIYFDSHEKFKNRLALIRPETDDETVLINLRNAALEALKNELNVFNSHLLAVQDLSVELKELHAFIDEVEHWLYKLPLNEKVIYELIAEYRKHVGQETQYFFFTKERQALDPHTATNLINLLFDDIPSETPAQVTSLFESFTNLLSYTKSFKERTADIYNLQARLRLSIQKMQTYVYKEEIGINNLELKELKKNIQAKRKQVYQKIEQLSDQMRKTDLKEQRLREEAEANLMELRTIREQIKKLYKEHCSHNRLVILKESQEIEKAQEYQQAKKESEDLRALLERQKTFNTSLCSYNEALSDPKFNNLINQLQVRYNNQRQELITKLKNAIAQVKAVNKAIVGHVPIDKTYLKNSIELSQDIDRFPSFPLAYIESETNKSCKELFAYITRLRQELETNLSNTYLEDFRRLIEGPQQQVFVKANPFLADFNEQLKWVETNYNKLRLVTLEQTHDLAAYIKKFDQEVRNVKNSIYQLNVIVDNASCVNMRLENTLYQCAKSVEDNLRQVYETMIVEDCRNNPQSKWANYNFEEPRSQETPDEDDLISLAIDTYGAISKLNREYVGKDTFLHRQDEIYRTNLFKTINKIISRTPPSEPSTKYERFKAKLYELLEPLITWFSQWFCKTPRPKSLKLFQPKQAEQFHKMKKDLEEAILIGEDNTIPGLVTV